MYVEKDIRYFDLFLKLFVFNFQKVSTFGEATAGEFNEDTEYLIRQDQTKSAK